MGLLCDIETLVADIRNRQELVGMEPDRKSLLGIRYLAEMCGLGAARGDAIDNELTLAGCPPPELL